MEKLFSPWRLRYIRSARRLGSGCVFCGAARARAAGRTLVLAHGQSNYVILNKYPYNNGHLMVVPNAHKASLGDLEPATLSEMMTLAAQCEAALRRVYRPTGINLGINLGRSAGAGIEGHVHLHIVPRWDGDTNFMTVVHDTRVIPEALGETWRRLRPHLKRPPEAPPIGVRRRAKSRVPVRRTGRSR